MFYAFFGGFDPREGFFYCIKISRNIEAACENGVILVTDDTSIAEWENALPVPEGMTETEWDNLPWWEHLPLSGAYELMDTVEITFTTSAP